MIWKELVKVGLLGTERGELSPEALSGLNAWGISTGVPHTEILLEGAAWFHQLHKAGFLLISFPGTLPEPVSEEDESSCSPASSRHLYRILSGSFRPALEEFVYHLVHHRKRLPPQKLPDLFQECLSQPELWEQLRPAIGKRGMWLLRQNPAWQSLCPMEDISLWEVGDRQERLGLLDFLHRTDPEKAIRLIEKTWSRENAADRLDFLKIIEPHLSPADEPFLEKCLDDKRKEVRSMAARLLARIGQSGLVERLFRWTISFFSMTGEKKPAIRLPKTVEERQLRNGIHLKYQLPFQAGNRASWLWQALSRIPPVRWEDHFQVTPEAFLSGAASTEWEEFIVTAITEALISHPDERWMAALAGFWQMTGNAGYWTTASARRLMERFPVSLINRIVLQAMGNAPSLLEETSLACQLLSLNSHPWEDRLVWAVISGFQNWMAGASTFFWNTWHYKRLLRIAAFRCSPDLLDQMKTGWPMESPLWPRWASDVEGFVRTIKFRGEMIREIAREDPPRQDK